MVEKVWSLGRGSIDRCNQCFELATGAKAKTLRKRLIFGGVLALQRAFSRLVAAPNGRHKHDRPAVSLLTTFSRVRWAHWSFLQGARVGSELTRYNHWEKVVWRLEPTL